MTDTATFSEGTKSAWSAFVSGSNGSTNHPDDQARFWQFVRAAERDGFETDVGLLIEAFDIQDVSAKHRDELVNMLEAVSGYLKAS